MRNSTQETTKSEALATKRNCWIVPLERLCMDAKVERLQAAIASL
ncbi:hypothetical protein CWATWH0402_2995 [Crocosphaera watsonii WH 0402]|uniref:Uncharacterized protein n=1 Tax=Crocosphaera watsonii WH 0402 TaxID=1284629 RepID=T2JWM8_CROWT|nr:hypothetical protein [Crocosphaera watsonii]CCQ69416.1 hypothetical protein CWATWH0402_2995 [Crocosphaera watsonii WH 0402]